MGSNGARFAVIAVAIAAVVGLFIVLSGDDDEPTTTTTAATTTTQEPAGNGEKPEKPDKPEPKPDVPTIVVKDGKPVGGIRELTFVSGEEIRFNVKSDEDAEVHFHGYDIAEDVQAGGEVQFAVKADIEGVFEVELEETATHIAEISVTPG